MEKYNGYTNYQTWIISMWINNEEKLYNYWMDRARKNGDDYALGEEIKKYFEEDNNPLADTANYYTDLLNSALGLVNWREVAQELLTSVNEQ